MSNTRTLNVSLLQLKDTTYLEKSIQDLVGTWVLDAVIETKPEGQYLVLTVSEEEDPVFIMNLAGIKIQGAHLQQALDQVYA